MDTSKEYIEMCRKATEIQEEWEPKEGDFVAVYENNCKPNPHIECASYDYFEGYRDGLHISKEKKSYVNEQVFLPRQDQLQEMVGGFHSFNDFLDYLAFPDWSMHFYESGEYKKHYKAKVWKTFDSFEKLWFVYVMHNKFNKHWTGTEWEEET